MDNTNNKQDAPVSGNGRMTMILAGIAVPALVCIGVVLYMQYTEYNYYQEPPSAWPAVTSSGGVPAPETPLPPLPPITPEASPAAPDEGLDETVVESESAEVEPSPVVPDEDQDVAVVESESAEVEPSAAPAEKEADSSDEPPVTETSDEPLVTETSDEPAPAPAGPAPLPSLFD